MFPKFELLNRKVLKLNEIVNNENSKFGLHYQISSGLYRPLGYELKRGLEKDCDPHLGNTFFCLANMFDPNPLLNYIVKTAREKFEFI